jgi:hypothetical protein
METLNLILLLLFVMPFLIGAALTEGQRVGDWLKWEQNNLYSREEITILAGSGSARVLTSGMVLGKATLGAATAAAVAGNTGNGTMGAVTVTGLAKPGVYRLVITEPASNAGNFIVEDPDGVIIGAGTVAVAFSAGGLAFTLADGSTDFIAGDSFTITVAAGTGKYVQLLETGATGIEDIAGILLLDTTAPDGVDVKATAIVRDAIVSDNGITWPSSYDATDKAAGVLALRAMGIIVREGA